MAIRPCKGCKRSMLALVSIVVVSSSLWSQAAGVRRVPARDIPVPPTLSPPLQELVARPISEEDKKEPRTKEDWQKLIRERAVAAERALPQLRSSLNVRSEPRVISGVKVFQITPARIAPDNRDRVLMHLHGGAYVFYPGESGTIEAVLMAHYFGSKVVSVDYRMAPDCPFPAGLEDAVTVWKELVKNTKPASMAIFGTSAGGGLTMATVLRLQELKLPLPGAIALGTPWCDITRTGDSWFTNEYVDSTVPYYVGRSKHARVPMPAAGI